MSKLNKSCISFIDTLKTSFGYFKNHTEIKDHIDSIDEKTLGKDISESLFKYTTNILDIVNSDSLPSSADLKFLDSVTLFDKKLSLKLFKPENKKTKKVIVKHLSNMLAASFEFTSGSMLPQLSYDSSRTRDADSPLVIPNFSGINPMELMNNSKLTDMFSNDAELSSVVDKMTKKLVDSDIDPMQLLGNLMSGDINNPKVKDLIAGVQDDIKGMDKEKLEGIAKGITGMMQK